MSKKQITTSTLGSIPGIPVIKKEEPKIPVKLVENNTIKSPKLIISKEIHQKINLLCNLFTNIEWSGVLFYDYTGEFNKDMVLTIRDILPKDLGDASSTSYDVDANIPAFMLKHKLTRCRMGHIHSHHSMATFFSGTDTNTLTIEGAESIHFLSLIVNNDNEYSAKITIKTEITDDIHTIILRNENSKSFGDVVFESNKKKEITKIEKSIIVEYCDVEIVFEDPTILQELKQVATALKTEKNKRFNYSRNNYIPVNASRNNYISKNNFPPDFTFQDHIEYGYAVDNTPHNNAINVVPKNDIPDKIENPAYGFYTMLHEKADIFEFILTSRAEIKKYYDFFDKVTAIVDEFTDRLLKLNLRKVIPSKEPIEPILKEIEEQWLVSEDMSDYTEILTTIIALLTSRISNFEDEYINVSEIMWECMLVDIIGHSTSDVDIIMNNNFSIESIIKINVYHKLADTLADPKISENLYPLIDALLETFYY